MKSLHSSHPGTAPILTRLLASSLLLLLAICHTGFAGAATDPYYDPVPHPAIPLLDELGDHVLDSAKPYSPKTSCGNANGGSGCHDYDAISHSKHFEMGRDEADDDFGKRRGPWTFLTSPGYFGGFNCLGPEILAKKTNANLGEFGDYGAAGLVMACNECHTGGGWSEKDRTGVRYDQQAESAIAPLDGDYFNRGTDESNQPVVAGAKPTTSKIVSRWDWKKSGVVENDCMMCHADYSQLRIFPSSGINQSNLPMDIAKDFDMQETPLAPYIAWWSLRNQELIGKGMFRVGATALLEFLNLQPGTSGGMNLVSFARAKGELAPKLNPKGKPILRWNAEAFDESGKVVIPMRRFPANDNCWQCHGYKVGQDRRGFWGFGKAAGVQTSYKFDVHRVSLHTETTADGDQYRQLETCVSCHTQRIFYKPAFANVDLNANHNFPTGHSDIDARRDLDNRPGPMSCEYCHNDTKTPGRFLHNRLLQGHVERWRDRGDLDGYTRDTFTRITKTHIDSVACQTCHINGSQSERYQLKAFDGTPLPVFYRYRRAEDGLLKIMPTVDAYQFRYYWKDEKSGRVLREGELLAAYAPRKDAQGNVVAGVLKDPETGAEYELPGSYWMPFTERNPSFPPGDIYGATHALKRRYDQLLRNLGLADPDVRMVWMESNDYVISHNSRRALDTVPCESCHERKQNGSFSALLAPDGILGSNHAKVLGRHADRRLVQEGVVRLAESYMKVNDNHEIVASIGDLLFATKEDPSLTALKQETARLAGGEWAALDLEENWKRMKITGETERQRLGLELGDAGVFGFSTEAADPRLRSTALASPVDPVASALFPHYRLETSVRDLTAAERKVIAAANLGKAVTDVFSLRMVDEIKQESDDFLGRKVLVKLPYPGVKTDPKQVRILSSDPAGTWRDEGIEPLLVQADTVGMDDLLNPKGWLTDGYVVFAANRTYANLALADAPEPVVDPGQPVNPDLPVDNITPVDQNPPVEQNPPEEVTLQGTDAPDNAMPAPSEWRTVQPKASCAGKSCGKALKKAMLKLKRKARIAMLEEEKAARVKSRLSVAGAGDKTILTARAALKSALADQARQAYEKAVTVVWGLHD